MSIIPDDGRMKPVIIIPPETVSDADIKELRDNGLCVIVAKNPGAVKFLDPIPAMSGRSKIEQAAIELSRKILCRDTFYNSSGVPLSHDRGSISRMFVDLLVQGTPLDPVASVAEVERQAFDGAKFEEVRKIAREEAREEAAKRKAEKAKKEK